MSDYKLVKKLSESAIVRNKLTGNLELWGINSSLNENTFILVIEGKEYKFVTSDSKEIASAIKEMTSTGAIAGYSTPFAFTKNKKGNTKSAETAGYKLVEQPEQLEEGKFHNFKKHPMKNEAKISLSLREINKLLREVESLVGMNNRLKTESEDLGPYWKRSARDVIQIKERTKNILNGIRTVMKGKINEVTTSSANPLQQSNSGEKLYTISIDFLNFENELSGLVSKHEDIIGKKVLNKEVSVRASKGYGQVEKDYNIIVIDVSIAYYKDKYNLIFKDREKKEYYVNTTFKIKIKDVAEQPAAPAPSPAPTQQPQV